MVSLIELVRKYYATVDTDAAAVPELFSLDAVYERPGYAPLVGRDAIAQFYVGVRVIGSGHHSIEEVIHQAERVAVRGSFTGRSRSGDELEAGFADFFEVGGGLIRRRTTYFYMPSV